MYTDEDILAKLDAAGASDEEKALLLEKVHTLVGEAISETLSEQQLNEYQAIIDNDDAVIDAWLEQHVPSYKEHPLYQEFEAGYEGDPEKHSSAKLFASVAWTEFNVPNRKAIIEKVLENFDATAQ